MNTAANQLNVFIQACSGTASAIAAHARTSKQANALPLPLAQRSLTSCLALQFPCGMPSGAALNLKLAVCPAAACSPNSGAKVPRTIGKCLPVLRRSMQACASPSLHVPSTSGLPVLRRPAQERRDFSVATHLAESLEINKQREASVYLHGNEVGTACLCPSRSPAFISLTSWSRGRRHCASLRQGQAGAPYRWR
jgi:hypothetical protein